MVSSFNKWFRLVGTPLFGLLIYLIIYYIDPRSFEQANYTGSEAWQAFCIDIGTTLIGAYLLSEMSIWVTYWLNRPLPWERRPLLRFLTQFLTLTVTSVATIWLLIKVTTLLAYPAYPLTELDELSIRQTLVFGSLMALCLNGIHTGEYFFDRWRSLLIEAERLKRESVEARYEALKQQLDPHFLFNNLNTLIYIVEEDPKQAVDFIEKLALVYRYVLQKREQSLVSLDDELTLARSYLYLLEKRFGSSLCVEISIADTYMNWLLPPLTIQMLLENAVKHNIINSVQPLSIRLFTNDAAELQVINTKQKRIGQSALQPGPVDGQPGGVGLRNIHNRYVLLGERPPRVVDASPSFSVTLTLIAP